MGEIAHDVEHVADQLRVQRRGRLVEEHELGLHCQRPGDRHALLLPAGELAGMGVHLVPQADPVEQRPAALRRRRHLLPLDLDGGLDDVLQGGHVGEQVEALEHHPDFRTLAADLTVGQLVEAAAAFPVADQLAVDPEPPGVDLLQVVDAAEKGALARARGPDDAHHLAGRDLDVDAPEHLVAAEALVHGLGTDHGGGHQLTFPNEGGWAGARVRHRARQRTRTVVWRGTGRACVADAGSAWAAARALSRGRSAARCRTGRR